MKKLLAALFVISSLQIAKAESAQYPPIEGSVVELRITRPDPVLTENARSKSKRENFGHSLCSGSFIDGAGDVLTAGHCAAGDPDIDVVTSDGKRYHAVIIATSPIHDLALLHIDRLNTPYLRPAETVARGEKVFILGSPLGITDTLSTGIVAKLEGDTTLVDCGALPGNSGSAVVNEQGQIIGVLTAGYIVGAGTTHLNVAQSLDAVMYFVSRALRGPRQ